MGDTMEIPIFVTPTQEKELVNTAPRKDKGDEKIITEKLVYTPILPYPARLKQSATTNSSQFTKFLSLLKQLHINLPFVNALKQMPRWRRRPR